MLDRFWWRVRQVVRQLWARVVAYAVLGVLVSLVAVPLGPLVPEEVSSLLGGEAVDKVLEILASSMLAVTIFALSITVTALNAAAGSATPRAAPLLTRDRTSQNVVATFIGAFLFSLVGVIALQAGAYGPGGEFVLFGATLPVVLLVVISLVRWTSHLMVFGRHSDTLARVEAATAKALEKRLRRPFLGGRCWDGEVPAGALSVIADRAGWVQYVDVDDIADCLAAGGRSAWLAVTPGTFVTPNLPLFHHDGGPLDEALEKRLRSAVSVGDERTFEGDPRFGLAVLAEIASRALSPAVNDPGTALDVLSRVVRVLTMAPDPSEDEPRWPHIHVLAIRPADLLEDTFRPIARDGASLVEVQTHVQKHLAALSLARPGWFGVVAPAMAAEAAERARGGLAHRGDVAEIEALAAKVKERLRGAEVAF